MRGDSEKIALKAFTLALEKSKETEILSLLTNKEKVKIGKRLLIAQAILSGKTRFEINEKIGVSPNTFAQINRWLENKLTEYSSAHKPIQANKKSGSRYTKPFSYEHLKRNYPAHFLLFSLAEELWKDK